MSKNQYYSTEKIDATGALYRMIISERSNGKTHSCLDKVIDNYLKNGKQGAYIRRNDEDMKGKYGEDIFNGFISNSEKGNIIEEKTGGKWNNIIYKSRRWYLATTDGDGDTVMDTTPFCFGFSLRQEQRYKGLSYPNITTIIFDEFIASSQYGYIGDENEKALLDSILSTIIRLRDDVTIYMLGNTINNYCPYFRLMGIDVKKLEQGGPLCEIWTKDKHGTDYCLIACEFPDTYKRLNKKSDKYFAFNDPQSKMISEGRWQIEASPHKPIDFNNNDICFMFFIKFYNELVQCEVVDKDDNLFVFCHHKTTPLKHPDDDLIFSTEYSPKYNYRRKINKPQDDLGRKLWGLHNQDKWFYSNDLVGDLVKNYITWCNTSN